MSMRWTAASRALCGRAGLMVAAGALLAPNAFAGGRTSSPVGKRASSPATQAPSPTPAVAAAARLAKQRAVLAPDAVLAAEVATETLRLHGVDTTLVTVGQVTYADSLVGHVTSPVSGRVRRIYADLGQQVHKGEALAAIDSPDMGTARADLEKARAELLATKHDLSRQESLYAAHACSERDVELARDAFRRARAERGRADKKWSLLGGGDTAAPGQLYMLRAPLDGVVLDRTLSLGEEIQGQLDAGSSGELFVLANLESVWVVADVYESDLGRVVLGARAEVVLEGGDARTKTESLAGSVEWISEVLDPNVRTAKVRCAYNNRARKLSPNTFVTLRIAASGRDALTVAKKSLLRVSGQTFVFVSEGRDDHDRCSYALRPVEVDEDHDAEGVRVPVYHGIAAGEQVVVHGTDALMQAMLQQQRGRPTW